MKTLELEATASVYPGADEVGLTLLARMSVSDLDISPSLFLIFRDPSTIYYIPNYEGQPMINTIQDQVFCLYQLMCARYMQQEAL